MRHHSYGQCLDGAIAGRDGLGRDEFPGHVGRVRIEVVVAILIGYRSRVRLKDRRS